MARRWRRSCSARASATCSSASRTSSTRTWRSSRPAPKNTERVHGRRVGNASIRAIDYLHRHGMYVVGGLIVGSPDDTREAIQTNLSFARRYVDWPYIQHPTPYPRTPMTRDFQARGLVESERLDEYDGTTAVVRTEHVPAEEVEFLRWRAERWMKARHFPVALAHDPGFVLRHAARMFRAHLPRRDVAHVAAARERTGRVPALSGAAPARARLPAGDGLRGREPLVFRSRLPSPTCDSGCTRTLSVLRNFIGTPSMVAGSYRQVRAALRRGGARRGRNDRSGDCRAHADPPVSQDATGRSGGRLFRDACRRSVPLARGRQQCRDRRLGGIAECGDLRVSRGYSGA